MLNNSVGMCTTSDSFRNLYSTVCISQYLCCIIFVCVCFSAQSTECISQYCYCTIICVCVSMHILQYFVQNSVSLSKNNSCLHYLYTSVCILFYLCYNSTAVRLLQCVYYICTLQLCRLQYIYCYVYTSVCFVHYSMYTSVYILHTSVCFVHYSMYTSVYILQYAIVCIRQYV